MYFGMIQTGDEGGDKVFFSQDFNQFVDYVIEVLDLTNANWILVGTSEKVLKKKLKAAKTIEQVSEILSTHVMVMSVQRVPNAGILHLN